MTLCTCIHVSTCIRFSTTIIIIISIMLTLIIIVNPGPNKTPTPVVTASLDASDSQQAASVAHQHTTGQDTNGMLHMMFTCMCACVRQ